MNDEITHMCVVHCLLRFRFPDSLGRFVVRIYADQIELVEVAEFQTIERGQLAPENKVQKLLFF